MAALSTIGTVAAILGTAHSVASTEEQKKTAREAGQKADREQAQLEADVKSKEKTDAARKSAASTRSSRLKRQRGLAGDKQGRQGTILAGGAPAPANTTIGGGTGKSLLGV